MRKLGVLFAFIFTLVVVPTASAEINSVFNGKIPCYTQGDGQRHCFGPGGATNAPQATVDSFDGTPIDVNVGFPSEAQFGPGPYPVAMYFHGFGGSKEGFGSDLKRFLNKGIAVFSMTERGFRNSCGTNGWKDGVYNANNDAIGALETAGKDCSKGFIHLMDTRHEVRDAQYLISLLVDEGHIKPKKIGSVGASYGGGKSMALATLKNRVMELDGKLAPWKSPAGTDLEVAAAAPIVPWSDFAYALLPNGRTLDYVTDSPYGEPFGVMKSGIISALLPSGDNFSGQNGPVDPTFDILGWKDMMDAGEPYGGSPTADLMFSEMTKHHSSYYIDDSVKPAPLLIAQGFTDDLFPIDEPLRYYNRTMETHPDADISLLFADIGHPRAPLTGENAQGRPVDVEMGYERVDDWFGHYLLDQGAKPVNQVEVKSQLCPYTSPSGGPWTAPTWADMSKGEIRLLDPTTRVIEAGAGLDDPALKLSTLNDGCTQIPETREPGIAEFELGTVPAGGVTLMGAPTVIADVSVENAGNSQIAARLLEISPNRRQRLIARGLYRPDATGAQVIQLHGNAYKFEAGTKIRLQLLPKDGIKGVGLASYARPSNDQKDITISNVDIRLPVQEAPGAAGGMVTKPAPKVLPAGAKLAKSYNPVGAIRIDQWSNGQGNPVVRKMNAKGRQLLVRVSCPARFTGCGPSTITVRGSKKAKRGKGRNILVAKQARVNLASGQTRVLKLKLSNPARKVFRDKRVVVRKKGKKRRVMVRGLKRLPVTVRVVGQGKPGTANSAVRRTGKVR